MRLFFVLTHGVKLQKGVANQNITTAQGGGLLSFIKTILNLFGAIQLVYLLISFLNVADVYAHALWIQTNPIEEKGQQQTVTIIYAEPGQTPEKISD